MKSSEFTAQELNNIQTIFTPSQIYSCRDKSEKRFLREGDLVVVRYNNRETVFNERTRQYEYNKKVKYTVIGTFVSCDDDYTVKLLNGRTVLFYKGITECCLPLEISREKYLKIMKAHEDKVEAERKEKERQKREYERKCREEADRKRAEELKREEELRKKVEEHNRKEKERRSKIIMITVGDWEDIIERIERLERGY